MTAATVSRSGGHRPERGHRSRSTHCRTARDIWRRDIWRRAAGRRRGSPDVAPGNLVARMEAALPDIIADIETLVTCESPSSDLDAVARSADTVARVGTARLGAAPERILAGGCTHLRWRLGG